MLSAWIHLFLILLKWNHQALTLVFIINHDIYYNSAAISADYGLGHPKSIKYYLGLSRITARKNWDADKSAIKNVRFTE